MSDLGWQDIGNRCQAAKGISQNLPPPKNCRLDFCQVDAHGQRQT